MNGVANGVFTGDTLLGLNNSPWVDFSEQSTIVGWSSYTNKIIKYKVVGNTVLVLFNITGTSNNTATTIVLPFIVVGSPSPNPCYVQDNGIVNVGLCVLSSGNSNIATFYRYSTATTLTATWTASGSKTVQGEIFYQISQ